VPAAAGADHCGVAVGKLSAPRDAGKEKLPSAVRIWTEEDAHAACIISRLWRWRIYAMALIVVAALIAVLVSRG
jgi:hypothetical protein